MTHFRFVALLSAFIGWSSVAAARPGNGPTPFDFPSDVPGSRAAEPTSEDGQPRRPACFPAGVTQPAAGRQDAVAQIPIGWRPVSATNQTDGEEPSTAVRRTRVLRLPAGVKLPSATPSETVNDAREKAVNRLLASVKSRVGHAGATSLDVSAPSRVARTSEGWLRSVGAESGGAFSLPQIAGPETPSERGARFLLEHGVAFGLAKPEVELRAERVKDRDGHRFVRFGQQFRGIPVYGASAVVQFDAAGDVEFALSDLARDDAQFHEADFSVAPILVACLG